MSFLPNGDRDLPQNATDVFKDGSAYLYGDDIIYPSTAVTIYGVGSFLLGIIPTVMYLLFGYLQKNAHYQGKNFELAMWTHIATWMPVQITFVWRVIFDSPFLDELYYSACRLSIFGPFGFYWFALW